MRKYIFIISLLYISPISGQDLRPDSLINAYLEKSKSVGMVAGYSRGEKQVVVSSGLADRKTNRSLDTEARVRIASISKVFTAVAILQLQEQKLLGLDQQISRYLNDIPPQFASITIEQLLSHSSGIRGYKSSKERQNMRQYHSIKEAIDIIIDDELEQEPGSSFLYTTYGYNLLGLIIEEVSRLDYEEYMIKNIFKPARMNSTGVEKIGSIPGDQSELFHRNSKGKVKEASRTNLSDRIPGGGFYSTASDMLRFGNALLKGQLISQSSFQRMTTNTGLKKQGNPYGMGLYLYGDNPDYGMVVGHSGGQIGASTQLMLLPDAGIVTFVASNTSGVWEHIFYLNVLYFPLVDKL